jgi:hypothetical protein
VLAAISGLTFLAHQHPTAFAAMSGYLQGAVIISFAGIGIWDAGVGMAHVKLIPFMLSDKHKDATAGY